MSSDRFEERLVEALAYARARRSPLLWTPGADILESAAELVVDSFAEGSLTFAEAGRLLGRAADLLLERPGELEVETLLAQVMRLRSEAEERLLGWRRSRGRQSLLWLLVLLLERLEDSGALTPVQLEQCATAVLDLDRQIAAWPSGLYAVRVPVLRALGRCVARAQPELRLAARLRLAETERGRTCSGGLTADIEALKSELEEAGPLEAEVREAIGRQLVETQLRGIEQRFSPSAFHFARAASLRLEAGDFERAAFDILLSLENWERADWDGARRPEEGVRLLDEALGLQARLGASGRAGRGHLGFVRATLVLRYFRLRLESGADLDFLEHVDPSTRDDPRILRVMKATYVESTMLFQQAVEEAEADPWSALVYFRGGCRGLVAWAELARGGVSSLKSDEELAEWDESLRDTLRHYLSVGVVLAACRSLSSARDSLPGNDLRMTNTAHPFASAVRLFEAAEALLSATVTSRQFLDARGLTALREALEIEVPPACSPDLLLRLARGEANAIAFCASRVDRRVLLDYVAARTATLLRQTGCTFLSTSERLLLSAWSGLLVGAVRSVTEDCSAHPPADALALMTRGGAGSFVMECLGRAAARRPSRGAFRPWPSSQPRFASRALDITHEEATVLALHSERRTLDFWSRFEFLFSLAEVSRGAQELLAHAREAASTLAVRRPFTEEEVRQRLGDVPVEREELPEATVFTQRPENLEQVSRLAAYARERVHEAYSAALRSGAVDERLRVEHASGERIAAWLASRSDCAIIIPSPPFGLVLPLHVFHHSAVNGQVARFAVGLDERVTIEEIVEGYVSHFVSLQNDGRFRSDASWERLGSALERLLRAMRPWLAQLAIRLEDLGIRSLVMVTREADFAWGPWESVELPDGSLFGDRFRIQWIHSLAELPSVDEGERIGTLQVVGEGAGDRALEPGRQLLECLEHCVGSTSTLSGSEAAREDILALRAAQASRLRFFAHGHQDLVITEATRLTLVDAPEPTERLLLKRDDIVALPLEGIGCVELWACASAAHARDFTEAGSLDEPEDLASAFLIGGARRVIGARWESPSLPSALMMELFALETSRATSDAVALEAARTGLRGAFGPGGPIEGGVRRALAVIATSDRALTDEALEELGTRALAASVHETRTAWYARFELAEPAPLSLSPEPLSRLVRFHPARAERRRRSLRAGVLDMEAVVQELLSPYRNPACWAGWRIVVRTLEDVE